jgi:hypothetical protein
MGISSNIPKNEKRIFYHENDTCRISYSFNGQNCPIVINVYNKLREPIYVDWRKSTITIFKDQMSLWDGKDEPEYESLSTVSPESSIEIQPFYLITKFVDLTPEDNYSKLKMVTSNGAATMRKYDFDTINTPLYFRSKIHYSASKNGIEGGYAEDQFWISSLVPTYSSLPFDQPDNFYLQKSTGFTTFIGIVAIAGLILLDANLPDEGE